MSACGTTIGLGVEKGPKDHPGGNPVPSHMNTVIPQELSKYPLVEKN
jgi:hypothetical protein